MSINDSMTMSYNPVQVTTAGNQGSHTIPTFPPVKDKSSYKLPMPPMVSSVSDSSSIMALNNWCFSAAQVYNIFVEEVYSRLEKLEGKE